LIDTKLEQPVIDSSSHTYRWKGEKKDCVSDMLKLVDVIQMQGIPARYLDEASIRGSRVHEATEDYDYGLLDILDDEWNRDNQDIIGYVMAYINFTEDEKYKGLPVATEISLYSETLNMCGTIDLVKKVGNDLIIFDKKTSSKVGTLRSILQLNAYRIMWNENFDQKVEKLYILQLKPNGEYIVKEIKVAENILRQFKLLYDKIKGDKEL
jgi:hypothetical protein